LKLDIKSVKVKNFLSFGSREQEIEFKTGVNMVLGKDLGTGRSNGAGKSSFLETIPFALYGTTHKDVVKSQLVNWKNRKGLEVSLNFEKGDIKYTIIRAIKPDNFEIWENNSLLPKPPHIRDYQVTLEEIIGLNFNTFGSLIHSNINSANRILSMSKPNKRKFIEDVFGLHLYSFLNKQANTKIHEQDDKIHDVSRTVDHNEISVIEIKEQIEEITNKISRLGSSVLELRDCRILLTESEEKYPDIDNDIHKFEGDIESDKIKQSKKRALLAALEAKISAENEKLRTLNVKYLKLEEAEKYRKQLKNLELNRGSLEAILEEVSRAKNEIESWTIDWNKYNDKLNEVSINVAKAETEFDNLDTKIKNLTKHKECPTCGQTLKAGSKDIIKTFEKDLEIVLIQKTAQTNNKNATGKTKKTLFDSMKIRKKELAELEKSRDMIYSIKDKIKVDYTKTVLDAEKKAISTVIKKLKASETKGETDSSKLTTKISGMKEELENLKSKKAVIEAKKHKIEALEMQVKIEERSKHEFQSLIATHKVKIDDLKMDNSHLNKKIMTYNIVIDYLEVIKNLCKDENIKQYAISSIMPYLNKQTNHYLSEVGYGFYCILDRWLDAQIKGPGVTNGSYGSLSGGEARGIDLAIQFALLDIARIQAGIWPDILIMDEVLDSSVDSKGILKLMDIIKMKQTEEQNKIFLISHRDEIEESIEADNTYFVLKDRGFSSVRIT
jgi:DNA repair exonuclease SbcCD ATPase subunit